MKKIEAEPCTGMAGNFEWREPKMEKFCDAILIMFYGDVIAMTSLKSRNSWFFKVWFRHNQFEKPQFG